jgi:predicted nuclease of restriction endonuclease-like RecB superfamily
MAGKKVVIDGIQFDSKMEAGHYTYFKGHPNIQILDIHPELKLFEPFEYRSLEKNQNIKMRGIVYTPDFIISLKGNDKPIVVEVKGFQTDEYMLRKKLFLIKYKDVYDFIQLNSEKECAGIFDRYH